MNLVANAGKILRQAKFRTFECRFNIGCTERFFEDGMFTAVEPLDFKGDRAGNAEQGERTFGFNGKITLKYKITRREDYLRVLRNVKESVGLHVIVPFLKAHIDGVGLDDKIDATAMLSAVQMDDPGSFVETSSLRAEPEVIHLEEGFGVIGIDGESFLTSMH